MIGMPVENGKIERDENYGVKTFQEFLTFLSGNEKVTALTKQQFESDILTDDISNR